MNFAAVDIGNTAVKFCYWNDSNIPRFEWGARIGTLREVACRLKTAGIAKVGFSTTRNLTPDEESIITAGGWWQFTADCRLPIAIGYKSPKSLGVDRLAAAVGAWSLKPGEAVFVADVGTALTLDVVSADGVYLGGNISVGLDMRLRALHEYTSRLPKVDFIGDRGLLGNDTVSALQLGARWGEANEIAGMYRLVKREFGCRHILLTGGGAPFIKNDLLEALGPDADVTVDFVPELVELGIKIAYEFNHDKEI